MSSMTETKRSGAGNQLQFTTAYGCKRVTVLAASQHYRMRPRHWLAVSVALASALVIGCGGSSDPQTEVSPGGGGGSTDTPEPNTTSSDHPQASDSSTAMPMNGGAQSASPGSSAAMSGGGDQKPTNPMQTSTAGNKPTNGAAGASGSKPSAPEMLDPKVDWTALKLVYATMYSAYDGVHKFQVPVHVEDTTIELSGWSAIPSNAVQFDPDPENEGVLITVLNDTPQVTIAARTSGSSPVGGTATLHVTKATPEEWELGKQRYTTGADWEIVKQDKLPPELQGMDVTKLSLEEIVEILGPVKFAELLADVPNRIANAEPPPNNLKCTNCHSTGAKYFEVQHTPTQVAQVSDADLATIFIKGTKPAGVAFRVLPKDMQPLYSDMHCWMSTDAEVKGLTVYLRSLTPQGQGDILGPDGVYRPADPDDDIVTIILKMLGMQ